MTVLAETEELARAAHYALLATLLYAPPSASLLAAIARAGQERDVPHTPLADAGERLRLASGAMDADAATDEFQALFIGAGSGGEIVPYASWHLTGFLMEEPLAHVRGDLAALGYDRADGVSEPEDHIAALCETMRLLIESGCPLNRQKQFFMRHLAPWGEAFAMQLQSAPSANYYGQVAALLREFLRVEAMSFAMVHDMAEQR
ncbi:MAG TPA: molecular chaperone TorD family protein [Novimethylophilus sp.]|jgi:TorA maturation chaperone TorD|uniref:TorD/DmsD family molecular chaperone n=1 Tax=Novimethylophilus sp. TaxID=2137426 RepID=UPI002F3EA0CB